MDLNITDEINTPIRRSAAAITLFQNKIVLFGGIPHEDDISAAAPESLKYLNEVFLKSSSNSNGENNQTAVTTPLIFRAHEEYETMDDSTSNSNDKEAAMKTRQGRNMREYFQRLRTTMRDKEARSTTSKLKEETLRSMREGARGSKQLAYYPSGNFPSIESRSPLFVLTTTTKSSSSSSNVNWKFIPCLLQPWSRHGHFLLVDPFFPNRLRVLGGRFWHIGDEVPEKDVVFELCGDSLNSSSPKNDSAELVPKWSEENTPTGFISLFNAAIAETDYKKRVAVPPHGRQQQETGKPITLAYTFGGMKENRTVTNSVYKISGEMKINSLKTHWSVKKLSTFGTEPSPQFKAVSCLVPEAQNDNNRSDDETHYSSLLTFDGFVGKTNVAPNVHELDLDTLMWRHVCMSSPIARGVGLLFENKRFLYLFGGHRTSDPITRVGSFVVFDLKTKKWVKGK